MFKIQEQSHCRWRRSNPGQHFTEQDIPADHDFVSLLCISTENLNSPDAHPILITLLQ
jgi:hypothetical protein